MPGGPTLPTGYLADGASYYDISTNAVYTAPVTVCLTYVPGSLAEPVRLLHWDADTSTWVDITTSSDRSPARSAVRPTRCRRSRSRPARRSSSRRRRSSPARRRPRPAATATFVFSTGTPNDQGATYECSLDGGLTWSECESPYVLTGLVPGNYELQVRATSSTGILDTTPASRSWTVVAPETTIDSGPAASTLQHGRRVPLLLHRSGGDVRVLRRRRHPGLLRVALPARGPRARHARAARPRAERGRNARPDAGRVQLDGRRAEHDDRLRAGAADLVARRHVHVLQRRADGDVRVLARRRALRELRLAVLGQRLRAGRVHALMSAP